MTAMATEPQGRARVKPARTPPAPPPPPPAPRGRRVPLTPMRQQAAKSMRKLAQHIQADHPELAVHKHLQDAARTLESGNEEGAQRHLRAAFFALEPRSLHRQGVHDDDGHISARQAVHGVHRHLLLVKDIQDVAEKNQAAIRRDSYGDDASSSPLPHSPLHADPNAGYGPGALAQKPVARQPGGDRALNAPDRTNSGGSDPAVADPVGRQPRGSKQFSYGWDDLAMVIALAVPQQAPVCTWDDVARVVELASRPKVVELVGPHGYIHGWIFVGIPGVGQEVFHPHHGHGTVTSASEGHVSVSFDAGHAQTFPVRAAKTPAHFQRMTDDELENELRTGQGKRFFQAMNEIDRRDQQGKADRIKSLYAEQPKTEADRNRVYQGLVNEGQDPEEAWQHAYSTDSETMARQAATQQLRTQGFKGSGFDALARDAYKQDTQRRAVAAEAGTNGYMLSPAGKKAGIEPYSLFTGPESRARKYASPELKEWWDQNGRPTAADFQASLLGRAMSGGPRGGDFYASVTWGDVASVVELSARTGVLAVTPAPRGKPGGPGLYDVKGLGHTAYEQQIVKALIEKRGIPPGKAYAIARGAIRRWSRGGGKVHPEVRAAAGAAEAGELEKQARAKAIHGHATTWDDVARVVEMATVRGWDGVALELASVLEFFNPAQPRVPPGSATAGQFAPPGGAQPAAKQTPAQQKAAKKAALLKQAKADRAKAAGILKQITALQKIVSAAQAATGKTKKASANVTKSAAPAKKTAAAAKPGTPAASAATAAKTATSAAKTTGKPPTASQAAKQLTGLRAQYKQLMAAAAQATKQAAKL